MVIGNFIFTYKPPHTAISETRMRAAVYWEVMQIPEADRNMATVRDAVNRAVQRLIDERPEIESVNIKGTIDL